MKLIAIANISNGKETIGLRILDMDTTKIKDISIDDIKIRILKFKGLIENVGIVNGRLEGTNGSIDRLPKIVNGVLIGKSPVIVMAKAGNIGYKVCNYKGEEKFLMTNKLIEYAKQNGIANGKIVDNHISAIKGQYRTLIVREKQPEMNIDSLERSIREYNLKCRTLGIVPLLISFEDGEVVVKSTDKNIRQAVIPNFATEIGKCAFDRCSLLRHIAIPNGIKKINSGAFQGCTSLKSIKLPESVESIWDYAFSGCTELEEIKINEGLTYLGIEAFSNCNSILNIELPSTLHELDCGVFLGCKSLRRINIPDDIYSIQTKVFEGCNSLKEMKMSEYLRDNIVKAFSRIEAEGSSDYYEFRPFISKMANRLLDEY